AVDMQVADAAVIVEIGECPGAGYGDRVIAAAEHDLGAAMQALRQIVVNILMGLVVVTRHGRHVAAIDNVEKRQQVDVVFEHVGKILSGGFANAGGALRGAGADDLALVPRHADEAHLGSHLPDRAPVRRAIGRAQEGRDALRLEGAVMQLRRIDVIVDALVLMRPAMLVRHVLPDALWVVGHGKLSDISCDRPAAKSWAIPSERGAPSSMDTSCISRPVSTFGVGRPQSGQRKLYSAAGVLIAAQ